jgi:hypothetical protein
MSTHNPPPVVFQVHLSTITIKQPSISSLTTFSNNMSTYTSPGISTTDGPTAIVLIDLYNDFLHPDGKLFNMHADTLKEHDTIAHLHQIVATARKYKIPIYYGLHQQWRPGFYQGWAHMAHVHHSQEESHAFVRISCDQ